MNLIHQFEYDGNEYQVFELATLGRVQLWYKIPNWGPGWSLGHGKAVPAHMTPRHVARIMERFITGELWSEEYNELVP